MPDLAIVLVFLAVLVARWCLFIVKRLPSDVDAMKASRDAALKTAIVFYWAITVLFVGLALSFAHCLITSCL